MASGGTILKTRKQPSAEIRVTPLSIPDISVVAKTLLIRAYYPNSDRIKSDGTYAYRYDANGNRTGKGTRYTDNGADIEYSALEGEVWTYRYDLFNRLTEVRKSYEGTENLELAASYSYDHRSLRVQRTDREGISTCYAYSPQGKLLSEETDNVITEYIYLGNKLAAKRTAGRTLWYSTDHLGSTIMLTDDAGEIVWSEGYTAFGEASGKTGYDQEERGRYTGKDYDEATGLYYYNARWYDAALGRFITEDPARDGANWYAYVRNNPLRYVDPTGLRHEESEGGYYDGGTTTGSNEGGKDTPGKKDYYRNDSGSSTPQGTTPTSNPVPGPWNQGDIEEGTGSKQNKACAVTGLSFFFYYNFDQYTIENAIAGIKKASKLEVTHDGEKTTAYDPKEGYTFFNATAREMAKIIGADPPEIREVKDEETFRRLLPEYDGALAHYGKPGEDHWTYIKKDGTEVETFTDWNSRGRTQNRWLLIRWNKKEGQ